MPETNVVHFKDVKHLWDKETRTWADPDIVYIGRKNATHHLLQSKWANPFVIGKDGDRYEVLVLYRDHLHKPENAHLLAALPELEGKTLVCWCAPQRCHGNVLIELLTGCLIDYDAELTPGDIAHIEQLALRFGGEE